MLSGFDVMLIGPNKAGKTNLINIAAGKNFHDGYKKTKKCTETCVPILEEKMEEKAEPDTLWLHDTSTDSDLQAKNNRFSYTDAIVYVVEVDQLKGYCDSFDAKNNEIFKLHTATKQALHAKFRYEQNKPPIFLIANKSENADKFSAKLLQNLAAKLEVPAEHAFMVHSLCNEDIANKDAPVILSPASLCNKIYDVLKYKELQNLFAQSKKMIDRPKLIEDYREALEKAKKNRDKKAWKLIKNEMIINLHHLSRRSLYWLSADSYHNAKVTTNVQQELQDTAAAYQELLSKHYDGPSGSLWCRLFNDGKPKSLILANNILKHQGLKI